MIAKKKEDAIPTTSPYPDTPVPEFVGIILAGGKRADEAMYYLLHQRLNTHLKERFQMFENRLLDDFEDVIEDFFLYLREGKDGRNQVTFQSLRSIQKPDAFEFWILNTFRNYLSIRAAKEEKMICTGLTSDTIADIEATTSFLTNERKLAIASHLVAYAHQSLSARDCFVLLRSLLSMLNKQQAIPNDEVARALGMNDISYRVTVHRMKRRLAQLCTRILHGVNYPLDEKHEQMAQQIYSNFNHLYPTLLIYYDQTINQLECAPAVRSLRQKYYESTGDMLHEPNTSFSSTPTIDLFWNQLIRLLFQF